MALINCPECGKEISDKARSCPQCGFVINPQNETKNFSGNNNSARCPRCGSTNIFFQREQVGNIGAGTNRVVIQSPKKSHGCLYWLCIGWWLIPMYWLCIGWWWGLLFGGKNRSGLNIHANKSINYTVAICQNCGYSWK